MTMNNTINTIEIETTEASDKDMRLRILYLYQMMLQHTDEDHPMTTQQIMERMEQEHGMTCTGQPFRAIFRC